MMRVCLWYLPDRTIVPGHITTHTCGPGKLGKGNRRQDRVEQIQVVCQQPNPTPTPTPWWVVIKDLGSYNSYHA